MRGKKAAARASELASATIDKLTDPSASYRGASEAKAAAAQRTSEFREMRDDLPKEKRWTEGQMAKAKKAPPKGNKRGPLRMIGKGKLIGVRVLPSLLARIDEWASKQDGEVSRPDAMRRLIERGLSPGRA